MACDVSAGFGKLFGGYFDDKEAMESRVLEAVEIYEKTISILEHSRRGPKAFSKSEKLSEWVL